MILTVADVVSVVVVVVEVVWDDVVLYQFKSDAFQRLVLNKICNKDLYNILTVSAAVVDDVEDGFFQPVVDAVSHGFIQCLSFINLLFFELLLVLHFEAL